MEFANGNLHGNLQVLLFNCPFTLAFFAPAEGKKESPKGKTLILGMTSEPTSCQPEGKVFCQIMEKGPDTAGAYVAFFFFFFFLLILGIAAHGEVGTVFSCSFGYCSAACSLMC